MLDIVLFDTIAKVDPDEWDQLAKGHATASYGWLRLVEDASLVSRQCHCLLARENSRLQAAIYFWRQQHSSIQISLDDVLFGRLTRIFTLFGLTALPALMGHDMFGHRQTILFRDDLPRDDRQRIFARMLEFLEHAARSKRETLCFRDIPANDADLASVFSSRKYLRSPEWPVCYLDIQWKTFAEYLGALRKQHPSTEKNIRREINLSRRAGITFERLNEPANISHHLHAIVNSHCLRLNGAPSPIRREFFEQIKTCLGDKACIYVAIRDGSIIGVLVRLQSGDSAVLPIIGIDRDYLQKHAVYFNLGYNNSIRNAIEDGLRRVGFGNQVYDTKLRRGCILSDANVYLRPKSSFGGLLLKWLMVLRTLRMNQLRPSLIGQYAAQEDPQSPDV